MNLITFIIALLIFAACLGGLIKSVCDKIEEIDKKNEIIFKTNNNER